MYEYRVKVEEGMIEGNPIKDKGVVEFLRIPYALPPVGELRWKAPLPMAHWQGTRKSDRREIAGIQTKGWFGGNMDFSMLERSEDCLYLNIWKPDIMKKDIPVYVWYHGGGFQGGFNGDPMFNGEFLAMRGIILVTVNYRLGTMGFFCHPDLEKESPCGTSGNYGFMDQIAALKWVKKNISAFGGDPDNITIGGQSAGGMSVSLLMTKNDGLFKKAVCESGDAIMSGRRSDDYSGMVEAGLEVERILGVKGIDELRKLPADRFVREDYDIAAETRVGRFDPVQDGKVIPKDLTKVILEDRRTEKLIIGSNRDEGFMTADNVDELKAAVSGIAGDLTDRFLEYYGAEDDAEARDMIKKFGSDEWHMRLKYWAKKRAEKGLKTWQYYFTKDFYNPGVGYTGASHSSELMYIFGNGRRLFGDDYVWTEDMQELNTLMSGYWLNFIKTGDPNGEDMPLWPEIKDEETDMEIGEETGPTYEFDDELTSLFMEAEDKLI